MRLDEGGTQWYQTNVLDCGRRNVSVEEGHRARLDRRDFVAGAGVAAATLAGRGLAEAQVVEPHANGSSATTDATRQAVKRERLGDVLLIGIDRPEAQNRIDFPTFGALGQAIYDFEHDDSLRVAVLHGLGADFSRGLDAQSWARAIGSGLSQPANMIDPLGTRGPQRSKPLVVAVQGQVVRIAHEMFLAADIRVAASDTMFDQGEVTAAAFPGGGATIRFVREAGWGNAMRYMLTGERWGAEEARRMGLVQDVTAPDRQLDRAVDLARKIAVAAPLGVRATLASAHRSLAEGEAIAFAALQPTFGELLRSGDRREFFRAQQENRAPKYVGR
jgi:enoyl-CoA hydratase/carnithine racemase